MKKASVSVGAALLSLFGTGVAFAEDKKAADNMFAMNLEEVLSLEVKTASKLGVRANQSPANLTVITQEQIRRYGYRTLGEALERVPGFLVNNLALESIGGIRGISPVEQSLSSRILYLIDGMRYNNWLDDRASIDEAFPVDIESIERIEVLRGDGSAVWGTNALYGVVNVITKDGVSKRNKQLMGEFRGSSRKDREKAYASWGDKTEGGLNYFSSLSYTNEAGSGTAFYPGLVGNEEGVDPYVDGVTELDNFRGNVKAYRNDSYINFVWGYEDRKTGATLSSNARAPGHDVIQRVPIRGEIGHKFHLSEASQSTVDVRAFHTHEWTERGYFVATERTRSDQSYDTTGSEIRYSQTILEQLRGMAGVEFYKIYHGRVTNHVRVTDENGELLFQDESTTPYGRTTAAYFFDLVYSPSDTVDIFIGGRAEKANGLDTAFGPRLALVARPLEDTVFRFLASQGFKNPSLAETTRPEGGESPEQEKIESYEMIVEQRLMKSAVLKASVFHSNLSDTIVGNSDPNTNAFFVNSAGFDSTGAELEGMYEFNDWLQGYASYSYSDAHNKTFDRRILEIPESLWKAGASVGTLDSLVVSPEIAFASSSSGYSGRTFSSYALANVTLLTSFGIEGFTLSASVYNLLDEEYARVTVPNRGDPTFEEALGLDRQYRLQASWSF